jgi:hypothetical protein
LYLRFYGVRDWHLPLYAGAALLASIGAAELLRWRMFNAFRSRLAFLALLFIVGTITAGLTLRHASLRDFTAPRRFLHDLWHTLPPDSIVIAKTDNASMMLSYYSCRTGKATESQRILHGQLGDLVGFLHSRKLKEWTTDTKVQSIRALDDPNKQPLKLRQLQDDRIRAAPLFADHHVGADILSRYLLPEGFLYHVADHPVSDQEIVQAELAWRKVAPDMYQPAPATRVHRLEREARGIAFWQRAGFFYQHELWLLAKEDYQRSLQWLPDNGEAWYGLGLSIERTGGDRSAAIAAYQEALRRQSWLDGPKQRLAALQRSG